MNFSFSFPGRVPVIFHWISDSSCNRNFEEIKNFKKRSTWDIFLQSYEPPDSEKKIFVI